MNFLDLGLKIAVPTGQFNCSIFHLFIILPDEDFEDF